MRGDHISGGNVDVWFRASEDTLQELLGRINLIKSSNI